MRPRKRRPTPQQRRAALEAAAADRWLAEIEEIGAIAEAAIRLLADPDADLAAVDALERRADALIGPGA